MCPFNSLPLTFINSIGVLLILSSRCYIAVAFEYGQHFPNGQYAVDHAYGSNGTFRSFTPLNYVWNYYEHYATANHPYDRSALIQAANGLAFYTARDANGYLLCDSDRDLEINPEYCQNGQAFHEHNALGINGVKRGNPFTQFWLDDNWLARYMSQAYSRPLPTGLVDQPGFLRWRVIGGDTTNWSPYNQDYFDTLALDGLYFLSRGEVSTAVEQWDRSLELSQATWDNNTMYFNYPEVHENYHLGLWAILTQLLLDNSEISPEKNEQIFQHSISLRRVILNNQEISVYTGEPIGWISNIGSINTLINTESISCCVLALGASAKYVFQFSEIAGAKENHGLVMDSTLSEGTWKQTVGPNFALPRGNYTMSLVMRTGNLQAKPPSSSISLKVIDKTIGLQLHEFTIQPQQLLQGQDSSFWSRVQEQIILANDEGVYDFVLGWDEGSLGQVEIFSITLS